MLNCKRAKARGIGMHCEPARFSQQQAGASASHTRRCLQRVPLCQQSAGQPGPCLGGNRALENVQACRKDLRWDGQSKAGGDHARFLQSTARRRWRRRCAPAMGRQSAKPSKTRIQFLQAGLIREFSKGSTRGQQANLPALGAILHIAGLPCMMPAWQRTGRRCTGQCLGE